MKTNEKGFGVVEILGVLVVVGLIGGTGWYVLQSKNKQTDQQSNTQATTSPIQAVTPKEEVKESPYVAYAHPTDGYSFEYPKNWKVEILKDSNSVVVTSPDYKNGDNTGQTADYVGAKFILRKDKIVDGSPKLEDVLNNKSGLDQEAKKITVDGKQAVRFKRTYPSASIKTYVYASDFTYEQSYHGPKSPDYDKYLPDYNNLLNTFKIK